MHTAKTGQAPVKLRKSEGVTSEFSRNVMLIPNRLRQERDRTGTLHFSRTTSAKSWYNRSRCRSCEVDLLTSAGQIKESNMNRLLPVLIALVLGVSGRLVIGLSMPSSHATKSAGRRVSAVSRAAKGDGCSPAKLGFSRAC